MIRAQCRAHRWQQLFRGTYATHTGEASIPTWWWAAHLCCGDHSHLFGASALQAWGMLPWQLPVQVGIPWVEQVRVRHPSLAVSRHRLTAPVRSPKGFPPAARVEFAVIDATQAIRSTTKVAALVTEACQKGKATPGGIARAMTSYKRLRHRALLLELVREVKDGAHSVLEFDAVRLVFKAHGLPTGSGQVREYANGSVIYRDRVLDEYSLIFEFDGYLGHADPTSRLRDFKRDNYAIDTNRATLRFGWADVHEDACDSAIQIVRALRRRGWSEAPKACGPLCPLSAQDWGHY